MGVYTIREIQPEELDELIQLCAEHAAFERAEYDSIGKADRLRQFLFEPSPRLYCLVVQTPAGSLVGYATFAFEFSTWDAGEYLHVDCLYLRPEARCRGLGWAIAKRIGQLALDLGATGIQFQTPTFNTQAIRLYQALGGIRKDKARFYGTRAVMERFLKTSKSISRQEDGM